MGDFLTVCADSGINLDNLSGDEFLALSMAAPLAIVASPLPTLREGKEMAAGTVERIQEIMATLGLTWEDVATDAHAMVDVMVDYLKQKVQHQGAVV